MVWWDDDGGARTTVQEEDDEGEEEGGKCYNIRTRVKVMLRVVGMHE